MERNIYKDFDLFARALVASNDVDPVYDVVKGILKAKPQYQPEWFIFIYTAFYNLETAIRFCDKWPSAGEFEPGKFVHMRKNGEFRKFGHERRGTCRNPINQLELFKAATGFIEVDIDKFDLKNNDNKSFRDALMKRPWHGAWSSYKIAELFEKSLGWDNLVIQDLGIDERDPNKSDGPIGGLRWIFGRDNVYNKSWFPIWNRFGAELSRQYGWDIGKVETCLCKFSKFMGGKYHVGHDISEFPELQHVLNAKVYSRIMSKHFAPEFWEGVKTVNKEYKSRYLKTGEILYKKYASAYESVDVEKVIMEL